MVSLLDGPGNRWSPGRNLWYNLLLVACQNNLLDPWSQNVIRRYIYCERHQTAPFPGAYDEQPAWWIDASAIIAREQTACLEKVREESGKRIS